MKLTKTMRQAYQLARELGEIHRRPPGVWGNESESTIEINSSTVVALVTRGLLYYSLWKQTESGNMFPIAAKPRASASIDDEAETTESAKLPLFGTDGGTSTDHVYSRKE